MANKRDTGIGSKFGKKTKRIINKDGSFNVRREGGVSGISDFYQTLVSGSWGKFLGLVLLAYLLINGVFAGIYTVIGIENLSGGEHLSGLDGFFHAYYFSCQTFTTVGYGAVSPTGGLTNVVAAIEALIGLMSFALVTGLVYGRFSKPDSKIRFSDNALISPYKDGKALMFRMVNLRDKLILEMDVRVILVLTRKLKDGSSNNTFHRLELEVSSISYFPLPWTVVHKIDEDSPFNKFSHEDLLDKEAELLIQVKGFDETFNQTVYQRFSYKAKDLVDNARFIRNFDADQEGDIVVDLEAVNAFERL